MPLPPPVPGPAPTPCNVAPPARDAILDDDLVDLQVRVAVLVRLEAAANVHVEFDQVCAGESFGGPPITTPAGLVTGRALLVTALERGLARGWFGGGGMSNDLARDAVLETKTRYASSSTSAVAYLIGAVAPPGPPAPLGDRVTWHFFDATNPTTPLMHVASDLALRLALPSTPPAGSSSEYIVLQMPAARLPGLRRPRFTDCMTLPYLDIWRPGGWTAPRDRTLAPLWEAIDKPMALAHVLTDLAFVMCHG